MFLWLSQCYCILWILLCLKIVDLRHLVLCFWRAARSHQWTEQPRICLSGCSTWLVETGRELVRSNHFVGWIERGFDAAICFDSLWILSKILLSEKRSSREWNMPLHYWILHSCGYLREHSYLGSNPSTWIALQCWFARVLWFVRRSSMGLNKQSSS